ncbi:hypothetical protein [Streptosporangium canum]|uniref:hypothetical protein n=1 Tax=Streptosporangium canum TaxID=324952 RepID=UPI0037975B8D
MPDPITPEYLDELVDTDPIRLKEVAISLLAKVERLQERNAELGRRYAGAAQLHPLDQTGGYSVCATCRRPYPCPTLRTLDQPSPAAAVQFGTDGAPGA